MSDNALYRYENQKMCWIPEAAYRKNDSVVDEANDATDTAFRMIGRFLEEPLIFKKRGKVYSRVAGVGPDYGYIAHHGYGEGKLLITMDMIDLSLMYYLCKACTTTDDSPSAGKYTHVYASTTARTVPPPSFGLLWVNTNNDTDNNLIYLYTGCVARSVKITGGLDQNTIQIQLEVYFANCVTGTALTNPGYPAFGTLKNYTFDRTSITYKKGGVSYAGLCNNFEITYDDGTNTHKQANSLYPDEAHNGNRHIQINLGFAPKQIEAIQDTLTNPLAPATASDLDITVKMYRDATNDYTEFAFEKLWAINTPDGTWDYEVQGTRYLHQAPNFILKPTDFEAGAKLTITEVNALDDDRYET
jgi:hypothetical protein